MVFGRVKFWLCKTTGWTCGINYGQKNINVVELKYRQHLPKTRFPYMVKHREVLWLVTAEIQWAN